MVDVEGPLDMVRQKRETVYAENKRSDQVVAVLEKYEVVVTALQKTK